MMKPIASVESITLDSIRGLLALVVCFAHGWQILINPQLGPYGWEHAAFGLTARYAVVAFYVLSGWVIAYSIYANCYRYSSFNPKSWASSRLFRIFPPLVLSILIALIIRGIVSGFNLDQVETAFGLARFSFSYRVSEVLYGIFTFGFMGDLTGGINGPLWSLAIEIQLYFLVLCLVWLVHTKSYFLFLLMICFIAYRATQDANLLLGYGAFWFGFLMFSLSQTSHVADRTLILIKYLGCCIFLLAIFLMLFMFYKDHQYLDRLAEWESVFMQLFFAIGFGFYLFGKANFESVFFAKLGSVSYSLYILHFPILLLFSYLLYGHTTWMNNFFIMWGIWLLGCCFTTLIVFKVGNWIERPSEQKKWLCNLIQKKR
jgi:peptidoglycan/LPS O-acetylase OafA/YrhL